MGNRTMYLMIISVLATGLILLFLEVSFGNVIDKRKRVTCREEYNVSSCVNILVPNTATEIIETYGSDE